MNALINLMVKFWKGVIGVIRLSFLIFIVFIFALASGWIKIECVPDKIRADLKKGINNVKIMISGLQTDDGQWQQEDNQQQKKYIIIQHQLQEGETLLDLQAKYGTDWRVIQKVNHITNENQLIAGQILEVPIRIREYG